LDHVRSCRAPDTYHDPPKIPNHGGPKVGITGASAVELRAQARPLGTEFLDAETGRQKSPLKCVNARRDKNPRSEWPEIPAETPYLAFYRKRAITGHSPRDVDEILKTHYLGGQSELAEQAIVKLVATYG
jgi:hypothetical protein